MYAFLAIKITIMDNEGFLSLHTQSFGEGSLSSFLSAMMFRINTNISGTFSNWCLVFLLIVFNFRYKNMDAKFRHHYEVIQEVRNFPLFSIS